MEYCGSIWDTTVKNESAMLENVQRRSARWARGARGIISVTALLKDLDWQSLADRRQNMRLCLFYKILNSELNIPGKSVDIVPSVRRNRKAHSLNLNPVNGRGEFSPFWKGTVARTVPEWNKLSEAAVSADSITTFKSQLPVAS